MPTRMTLQLADCSITRPYGVIEDVLVKFKHLIFPVDFIVIDIEEGADILLILGSLFFHHMHFKTDILAWWIFVLMEQIKADLLIFYAHLQYLLPCPPWNLQ